MNSSAYSIEFSAVTKEYSMVKTLKDKLFVFFNRKSKVQQFKALDDVSFKIKKGEVVGLIGLNGSGKSTLANLMIGATGPTTGTIDVDGHIELIAIGVGLSAELTGIENIYQKCYMMGMSKKQIKKIIPDIIEFSELGEFIHQPIKKYSSGMRSRLGFSISIQANPDILIIDEALSVGDKAFAEKCLKRITELIKSDKTVVFVSHSNAQIKQFCDHVIWLDRGKVIADSHELQDVLVAYDKYVASKKKNNKAIPVYNPNAEKDADITEKDADTITNKRVKRTKLEVANTVLSTIIIMLIGLILFVIGFILSFYLLFN